MRIRQLNHSTYQVAYHLVWGTKYRRKVLKPYVRSQLVKCLFKVARRHEGWFIQQVNTDLDHVHLLMEFPPPSWSVATVVQELKTISAKYLNQQFAFLSLVYPRGHLWGVGYFVSTVGLNETEIKRYIERQSSFDHVIDITDEFS